MCVEIVTTVPYAIFISRARRVMRMSLEAMRMVEKAESDARKMIADAKADAKAAADNAARSGRERIDAETEKARKSAEDILENAKLVGKASCTDIDRASADAVARLRSAAEGKLPEAAKFIAERITEDL